MVPRFSLVDPSVQPPGKGSTHHTINARLKQKIPGCDCLESSLEIRTAVL
jgi:hypothetical protein